MPSPLQESARRSFLPAKSHRRASRSRFEGDRLIGLNEISPFQAELASQKNGDGGGRVREVVGIGISVPKRIRRFLEAIHYEYLIAD